MADGIRERVTARQPQELRALRDMVQKRGLPLDGPLGGAVRGIRREHALTDSECAALEENRLFAQGLWYTWAYEVALDRPRAWTPMDDPVQHACLVVLLLKGVHDAPGPVGSGFAAVLRSPRNMVLYNAQIETLLTRVPDEAEKARIRRDYIRLPMSVPWGRVSAEFKRCGIY